ncbi:MAG: cell surface protein SprA, partial [Verrucomicrobia bacterium]|nr:cell surface protein SprA [Cytophagales bacterium]
MKVKLHISASQHLWLAVSFCLVIAASGSNTEFLDRTFLRQQDTVKKDTIKRDTIRNRRKPNFQPRDRYGDPFSNRINTSPLLPQDPKSVKQEIQADSVGNVVIQEKIGDLDYRPPTQLNYKDFSEIQNRNLLREAWKSKADVTGKKEAGERRLIPKIFIGPAFDRIFGGSYIDFRPNGFVTLDFGAKFQRVDNPAFPVNQRKTGIFDFEQQISLNLTGKVGEKLKMNANFDTKASFAFEQNIKLEYTGFEEDIIQKIEAGNVTLGVNSSLIQAVQSQFGIKTQLRFGKLNLSLLAANQRARTDATSVQNGVQTRNFEVRASDYEENRHFFLSQFFRDNYENALRNTAAASGSVTNTNANTYNNLPNQQNINQNNSDINAASQTFNANAVRTGLPSGVIITRVEVYVTNRTTNTTRLRNVAAFMDLGESGRAFRQQNPAVAPKPGFLPADNVASNSLYSNLRNNGSNTRKADNVSNTLTGASFSFEKGTDFEVLRGMRRLDDREFTFNTELGYISLSSPLRNDEVLAVSFEYTYNGVKKQVGELTDNYQNSPADEVIFMKMIRPSTIRTDLPMWNLMMKNIYSLGTTQINPSSFQFRVVYRDDLTGIDNPSFHEGRNLKNIPLVQVFGLDQLNQLRDPQPDGNFDYLEGITIDSQNGRIIFPVLEPFGSFLTRTTKKPPYFFAEDEVELRLKYIYDQLYRTTRNQAQQLANLNKFFLKGSYQATAGNNVPLGGLGVQDQTVTVTAGGVLLVQGRDYIVEGGQVTIINESIKASGKEINISYEKPDLFQNITRSLLGMRAEYTVGKDFTLGATLLRLRERTLIRRIGIGDEPTNNTMLGFDVNYRKDSRFLTKLVDKLPFISTKEVSNVTFNGEFAKLFPGVSPFVKGYSFIDDFEGVENFINLSQIPQQRWRLGATPLLFVANPAQNDLSYAYRRAKLAWYSIDNTFYGGLGGNNNRPASVTDEDVKNHYFRRVEPQEIFRGKAVLPTIPNQQVMEVAYYPEERGPYNFNPDLTSEGKLRNPRANYGAITRAMNYEVDFDNANVQYIEFWLLDPFIRSAGNRYNLVDGRPADQNPGGDLYLNLGNVSEDVLKDGRHAFENGLPANGDTTGRVVSREWGLTPRQDYLLPAFDNTPGARQNQDVGLDGLNSANEVLFNPYDSKFVRLLPANLTPQARTQILSDPSADDFVNYLGDAADQFGGDLLARYKNFNGLENNSPDASNNQTFTAAATNVPDNEDLNTDLNINDLESYYQYKVSLRRTDMTVGRNYIVDRVDTIINGDQISWYQFRIPIRNNPERVGNIDGFKS